MWIEITWQLIKCISCIVTPFAGVWIEIKLVIKAAIASVSHSLRGSVD